jgi:hypothetical protein
MIAEVLGAAQRLTVDACYRVCLHASQARLMFAARTVEGLKCLFNFDL